MKNASIFKIALLIPAFAGAQSESILRNEIIKDQSVLIERITQYKYTMPLEDSSKINGLFEGNLKPEYVEVFGPNNNLKRKEYYDDGKIRSAYNYFYKDGKLTHSMEDTLYKNYVSQTIYKSLPGNAVHVTTVHKNRDSSYYISRRDCNDRTIAEYILNKDQDTSSFIRYAYDPDGNMSTMVSQYHKNEKRNSTFFIYDKDGKMIKNVTFDISGKLIKENNYHYTGDNICTTVHSNYTDNTVKHSTEISFKDSFGNIYKQYLRLQYQPDQWIVLNYKIEYAGEKGK